MQGQRTTRVQQYLCPIGAQIRKRTTRNNGRKTSTTTTAMTVPLAPRHHRPSPPRHHRHRHRHRRQRLRRAVPPSQQNNHGAMMAIWTLRPLPPRSQEYPTTRSLRESPPSAPRAPRIRISKSIGMVQMILRIRGIGRYYIVPCASRFYHGTP